MSKYFSTRFFNPRMVTAFVLVYVFGVLVIWDEANPNIGIWRIITTVIIAFVIDIVLFLFRETYNNSKGFRILAGSILLIIYLTLGLKFQGLLFHFMFYMTIVLALTIASLFLDLSKL